MAEHNELGIRGEEIALEYLLEKNFTLLDRNWRFQKAELDLVMEKNNTIVVVEVKTRVSNYAEEPEMAVKRSKQKLIVFAANEYVQSKNIAKEVRFDIIGIILNQKGTRISHIEGAFTPGIMKPGSYR